MDILCVAIIVGFFAAIAALAARAQLGQTKSVRADTAPAASAEPTQER